MKLEDEIHTAQSRLSASRRLYDEHLAEHAALVNSHSSQIQYLRKRAADLKNTNIALQHSILCNDIDDDSFEV